MAVAPERTSGSHDAAYAVYAECARGAHTTTAAVSPPPLPPTLASRNTLVKTLMCC